MQTLTVFISSPGDVQDERTMAGRVIERLQGKYWSFVRLDDVFWEYKAIRATAHYQDELINPGHCDLVIGIVWSRLGSPLPDRFRNARGEVMTGTEWELEEAFAAHERNRTELGETAASPDILIYRRTEKRPLRRDPEEEIAAAGSEAQLDAYLRREYLFPNGTIKRPVLTYNNPAELEDKLFSHLEQLVLKRIPKLKAGYEPPPISGSPFKNLKHFDFSDADRFFGRNRAVREVQARLLDQVKHHHSAFVLIYGASGYGKSSLMRAGLAPALTRPGALVDKPWRRVIMLPQGHESGPLCEQLARALFTPATEDDLLNARTHEHWPLPGLPELESPTWDIGSFARALADPDDLVTATAALLDVLTNIDRHLLLQIDQLEEAFTHESITEADRENFFRALSSVSRCGRVWILATMRSEFFPRISTQVSLHQLIQRGGGYILQPASDQELREIIRYPAFAARIGFERLITPRKIGDSLTHVESLDDQILLDAKGSQDALPLLEFTLHQLYAAIAPDETSRKGDTLLWDSYIEIGGLHGSIATVANHTFQSLRLHEQEARDKIFGNLVQVDAGGSDSVTRMRTPLEELIRASPGAEGFIAAFRSNNLLIADEDPASGGTVITLAHESLLTHWPVLHEWVEDHRGILRGRQRLREHCAQWIEALRLDSKGKGKRPADYLLEGGRLAEAEEVINSGNFTDIAPDERQLIAESRKASNKRIRFFQAASVVFGLLAIGAGVLGWVANQRKKEANQARDQAQQSEGAAQRAKGTAEGLIGSMLYDLRDKLAPIGRTDLLDDVSLQAEEYFKNNPSTSPKGRRQEATMWNNRGNVFLQSGNLKGAREAYEKGIAIYKQLNEADPKDPDSRNGLGVSYGKMAVIARAEGNLAAAREAIGYALELDLSLSKEFPDNPTGLEMLCVDYQTLGNISQDEGDLKAARGFYQKGLDIAGKLAADDPGNPSHQKRLSAHFDQLGMIDRAEGDLSAARGVFLKSLEIDKRLAEADPKNAETQLDLSIDYEKLGSLADEEGDPKGARPLYQQSLAIREHLAAIDPRNSELQIALCYCHERLGKCAQADNDLKGAKEHYEKALAIGQRLADADPANPKVRRNLTVEYERLGDIARAENNSKAAQEFFEKSLVIRVKLAEAEPRNVQSQLDLDCAYYKIGETANLEGDLKAARESWTKGLEIGLAIRNLDPGNANVLNQICNNYYNLGALDEAENDLKAARESFERGRDICKSLAEANPGNFQAQYNWFNVEYKLCFLARKENNPAMEKGHELVCYEILHRMVLGKMPLTEPLRELHEQLRKDFEAK